MAQNICCRIARDEIGVGGPLCYKRVEYYNLDIILLRVIHGEMKRKEMRNALGPKNDAHFRLAYPAPTLSNGLIEMSKWKPLWAFLPVETIVAERQEQYYALLGKADAEGDATSFVEFMIKIIKDALLSTLTMEVSMDVTMEVKKLLRVIHGEMKRKEIQNAMGLKNDDHFRLAYLAPALADGLIEMTQPDSPKSPTQRYRLTEKGRKARGL